MGKLKTGFRIFGDEINREEAYLDVKVVGTDKDGRIYFSDVDDKIDEEWSFSGDELGELYEEQLIIPSDEIPVPKHEMWKTLENIGETRVDVDINNFVDDHLMKSSKHLFQALIEAGQ
jgi:hypothetical protein